MCVNTDTYEVKSLSRVWLFATPGTVAYQAPLFMGFSRQEYWSGLPFPSPSNLLKIHFSQTFALTTSIKLLLLRLSVICILLNPGGQFSVLILLWVALDTRHCKISLALPSEYIQNFTNSYHSSASTLD